jgi:hypothetical protein
MAPSLLTVSWLSCTVCSSGDVPLAVDALVTRRGSTNLLGDQEIEDDPHVPSM